MDERFPADKLERAFWTFHRANPDVYDELVRLAMQVRRRGHTHYAIKALFEIVRYHRALRTVDDHEDFKLNNNYTALYARLIMKKIPRLDGFFSLRVRKPTYTQHRADDITWQDEEARAKDMR